MNQRLPKILSREKIQKLLEAIDTESLVGLRNRLALELMYRAGLRVSEVCNLACTDIDLQQGFIFVQCGKGNKDRTVPLDPTLRGWCRKWLKVRPQSEYFISTMTGGKVSDRYLRQVCVRLSEKTGVYLNDNHKKKAVHPHTFRHCFGTELIEDGFTLPEVQQLLGHSSINSTIIYTHTRPKILAEKIRKRASGVNCPRL